MKLLLGHSPDADDAFMFYAMAKGLVNLRGHEYEHVLQDIETLNRRCRKGELDVSAVSFHAYTTLADEYTLLPCGASFGDGYGPCLVAKKKYSRVEMKKLRIAVPGLLTSAYLTLQLYLGLPHGKFQAVVVPFDKIQDEILAEKVDAGLIIHEGQLTYAEEGFTLCEDLGQWWARETGGLPLPLGGNVVRRALGPALRKRVSDILTASIQFSLDHRPEAVAHSLQWARDMGKDLADRFVGMYVNHWTLDYGERGRESIRRFLARGQAMGAIPKAPPLEFVV